MSNPLKDLAKERNSHREPAPIVDKQAFINVVKSRRSVRIFSGDPIPEQDMKDCIELALLAPNSSNLQSWEFYWIRTPKLREEMNKAFLSQPAVTTAQELVVAVAKTNTWRKHRLQMLKAFEGQEVPKAAFNYYKKLVPLVYNLGPFGIFGFMKKIIFFFIGLKQATPREMTDRRELEIWAVKSTALACENLMLALRAYGYDSCPMEGMDSRKVRKLLGLKKDSVIVMGVSAGKRAEDGVYGKQFRFPTDQFVFEV